MRDGQGYEILHNGVPRTYRDLRETAFEAARYANAAAAISVTRQGGASAPTDAEIRSFLAGREGSALPNHNQEKINA